MQFYINYKYFPSIINQVLFAYDPASIIHSESEQADEYIFEALSLYDEFPLISNKEQLETHLNIILIDSFNVFPRKLTPEDYRKDAYVFDDKMINDLWRIRKKWLRMYP